MRLADVVAVLFSDFFWASLDGELGRIVDAVKRKCYGWGVDNCNGYPSTESEG